MDLDQFKHHWQNPSREAQQLHAPENLERIVADTLARLEKTRTQNRWGNRLSKIMGGFILIMSLANLNLVFSRPHIPGLDNGVLALFVVVLVGSALLNIWMSSQRKKIFEFDADHNLKKNLEQAIARFKRFTVKARIIYSLWSPIFFFSLLQYFGQTRDISIAREWLISGTLTLLLLTLDMLTGKARNQRICGELEVHLKELSD